MTMLQQLQELTERNEKITGDIINSGNQVRITTGDGYNYTPVGPDQTFSVFPELGFTRLSVREQGDDDMLVINAIFTCFNEKIGIVDNGEHLLFPCYDPENMTFLSWRNAPHILNVEFMNPNPNAVEELMDMCNHHGFVTPQAPQLRQGQMQRERTSTLLYDMAASGRTKAERHRNRLTVDSVALVPDARVEPLRTEYAFGGDTSDMRQRDGFTGFTDVLIHNMTKLFEAYERPDTDQTRGQARVDARSRMDVLTGTDRISNYPLRPALGYVRPANSNEISLFPPRDDQDTSRPQEAPLPPVADTGEEPF
jgi:hypothetical protein